MRLLVVVAFLVAVVIAEEDHSADFEKIDERLDRLTSRLQGLVDNIDNRVDPERIRRAHSLEQRVVRLEGDGCGDREFQCGSDNPQCVGALLVCDGVKDCRNGHDEENCELPTASGASFEGHVISDSCTKRRPDIISFDITKVRRDNYFNTVAFVNANIRISYDGPQRSGSVVLPTTGYYNFGQQRLVLNPPESDRLLLTCDFDGYNLNRCNGEIKHEASLEVCATILFTRA